MSSPALQIFGDGFLYSSGVHGMGLPIVTWGHLKS
jgi:hypothetical protein